MEKKDFQLELSMKVAMFLRGLLKEGIKNNEDIPITCTVDAIIVGFYAGMVGPGVDEPACIVHANIITQLLQIHQEEHDRVTHLELYD